MKNKTFRKWLAVALLGCILLLSACGSNVPESATAATAETATAATETAETATAKTTETEPLTEDETEEAPDAPPFFVSFTANVSLTRGSEFNVHKYVSYIDDLDPEVELVVEGSVDTETVGSYPLTLTLEDDSGNVTSSNMTVNVTEPEPSGSSGKGAATVPKSFATFRETYRNDETMVGIDVSRWQGDIDFRKVAAAGCEFVIIRMGGYSDGVFTDKYFNTNFRNAKAAGLKVGVYWYSEENSADMVREDAAYLYSLLNGETLDLPIFFDWEDYRNIEDYKMSLRDLNEMFLAFRAEAEARGYEAALYNSKYYLGLLWSDAVKGDGVWLAHYTDQTNYEGKYFLWQQGFGRIDGIAGDVDVDVLYPAALQEYRDAREAIKRALRDTVGDLT